MNHRRLTKFCRSATRPPISDQSPKYGSEAWAQQMFNRRQCDGYLLTRAGHTMPFLITQDVPIARIVAIATATCYERYGSPLKVIVRDENGQPVEYVEGKAEEGIPS